MKQLITVSILASLVVFLVYLPQGEKGAATVRGHARSASSILLGDVTNISSYYGSDGEIYSDVAIQVSAAVKESAHKAASIVTFTVKGGTVGDTHVIFTDVPAFNQDESVVVFMDGDSVREKYTVRDGWVPEVNERAIKVLDTIEKSLDQPILEGERRRARDFMAEDARTSAAAAAAAADSACFVLIGPKWADSMATYKIGSTIPTAWQGALTASAASWNNGGTVFRLKPDTASTNEFLIGPVASAATLASTRIEYDSSMRLRRFTMTFSNAVKWSLTGEPGKYDVESVTTHELGHALGLTHPSGTGCSEQTMWATAATSEVKKRSLENGDKAGLAKLYTTAALVPPPTPVAPPPPPPPPVVIPAPVVNTMYTFPASPLAGQAFTLWLAGSAFNVTTAQIVIDGPGCPSSCVLSPSVRQVGLLSVSATLNPKGTYTAAARNTSTGALSASKPITIR